MNNLLKIKSLSAYSCLAKGAEFTAAAMRCGYDGFAETSFTQPHSIDKQLGAMTDMRSNTRGLAKLIELCADAVTEISQKNHIDVSQIPLYICLQERDRLSSFEIEELQTKLFDEILNILDTIKIHPHSRAYIQGKAGFATALKQAQIDIYDNKHEEILIISVDSLINNASLAYYGGDMYGEGCRLLTDTNSNGFIPGEAATAILLSKPIGEENEVVISGVGTARETATIYNEEELLRSEGLSKAIMEASDQAQLPIHETSFRVGSMSGEEYFFDEATLAQIKTLKQKIPDHPLWHPADSIGEVGAAIGGAMVIQTYYAMINGYASGDNALCHISNDDELRGAFIVQHTNKNLSINRYTKSLKGMYFSDTVKAQLKHDAPYAWFLLHQAQESPLFKPKDIQRLEERLESYIACFILSHKANDPLLAKLNLHDWGAVYVMARVALACEDKEAFALAVNTLANKQQTQELTDALCLETSEVLQPILQKLMHHENVWARVCAVNTIAAIGIEIDTKSIERLLSDSIEVQVAILELIGKYKLKHFIPQIITCLSNENEEVRYAATTAGSFLKLSQAHKSLQAFCFTPNPFLKDALSLLYHVIKDDRINDALHHVAEHIPSARIRAYSLAMAGLPESVPLLLEQMKNLEDSRHCAEAFCIITGIDMEEEDLSRNEPLSQEEEAILVQSQKEDEWSIFYEDDLPLPNIALLGQWWKKHQHQFIRGERYLSGKLITQENLIDITEHANQLHKKIAEKILLLKYMQNPAHTKDIFHV